MGADIWQSNTKQVKPLLTFFGLLPALLYNKMQTQHIMSKRSYELIQTMQQDSIMSINLSNQLNFIQIFQTKMIERQMHHLEDNTFVIEWFADINWSIYCRKSSSSATR